MERNWYFMREEGEFFELLADCYLLKKKLCFMGKKAYMSHCQ